MSEYNFIENLRDDQKFPPKGFNGTNYQRTASVSVTSAEILALNTTPKTLIASPGEDNFIIVDEVFLFHDHGGTDYVGGDDLAINYTDGSGDSLISDISETAFLEASADAYALHHGIDCIPVSGAAVVLFAKTSDPTTGDGTFTIKIKYRIETF